MQAIRLFRKHGLCKYYDTCCKLHYNENCEIENCKTKKCANKHHPKTCKYFSNYNGCKFGSFSYFGHVIANVSSDNEKVQFKLNNLENQVKEREKENKVA